MIWAYEYLPVNEVNSLIEIEPFFDLGYDVKEEMFHFQTFHKGFSENGNQKRCLRLFRTGQIRQGFISETWGEAKQLCEFMQGDITALNDLKVSYPWIEDYYKPRKKNNWLHLIAVPVSEFIRFYEFNDEMLEMVDINSLLR